MKIATWNVNSIRARTERLVAWLTEHRPDVLCLQETKVEVSGFPTAAVAALGYEVVLAGQRSYNGVAICSLRPLQDVRTGLDDDVEDSQARIIEGTLDGVRVISVYMPNGSEVPSDKYEYKLAWMERFRQHLFRRHKPDEQLVICGDYNVAPEPIDVYDPVGWVNEPIFHVDAREALKRIAAFGLVDVMRQHNPNPKLYTYWDYRDLAFNRDNGLRIDHILATRSLAERCTSARVDRNSRRGKAPSDHAALVATFEL